MAELKIRAQPGRSDTNVILNSTEQIWQDFGDRLRAFIARRVGSTADAEDILQDVFLRIHLHADSVERSERLTSWLFQVTRNAIVDYYRSPTRREKPEAVVGPEPLHQTGIAPPFSPLEIDLDASQARKELARCLQPMLGQLPAHYGEAVALVDMAGLTHSDVAARLGLSVSGVKSRVQRGRRALHATLVQCCPVQLDASHRVIDYQPPVSACTGCGSADRHATADGPERHQSTRCCAPLAAGSGTPGSHKVEQ